MNPQSMFDEESESAEIVPYQPPSNQQRNLTVSRVRLDTSAGSILEQGFDDSPRRQRHTVGVHKISEMPAFDDFSLPRRFTRDRKRKSTVKKS